MEKRPGRPPSKKRKAKTLQIRLTEEERQKVIFAASVTDPRNRLSGPEKNYLPCFPIDSILVLQNLESVGIEPICVSRPLRGVCLFTGTSRKDTPRSPISARSPSRRRFKLRALFYFL